MYQYRHHIGDYRSATVHLSPAENLAYREMIELYYDTEAPLPADVEWIARRVRADVAAVQRVLADFFVFDEDRKVWRQKRCDAEIADYRRAVRQARVNGKRGGRPPKRTGTGQEPDRNRIGSHPAPGSKAIRTPVSLLSERESERARAHGAEPEPAKLPPRLREPGPLPLVADTADAHELREWLLDFGVLRLSPKKLDAVLRRLTECCWQPKDLQTAAETVGGKDAKQRASRLAALLLDAERFDEFNNDLCRRQAEARNHLP